MTTESSEGVRNTENYKTKSAIFAEVKREHGPALESTDASTLLAWQVLLQTRLLQENTLLNNIKEAYLAAENDRMKARSASRASPKDASLSTTWHELVKIANTKRAELQSAKEIVQKTEALWNLVSRYLKKKGYSGQIIDGGPKRKSRRTEVPQETCPYCLHIYTVRDGCSTKVDSDGKQMHNRKCQCRGKTPPCKNCPICKKIPEIMAASSEEQMELCQALGCEICACSCPAAGKWIESDRESREAFRVRTMKRHADLTAAGWQGSVMSTRLTSSDTNMRPLKRLSRLPADIKRQLESTNRAGHTCGHPHEDCTSECCSAPPNCHHHHHQSPQHSHDSILAQSQYEKDAVIALKDMGKGLTSQVTDHAPPALPGDIVELVEDVFLVPAGAEVVNGVLSYLNSQRVLSFHDLNFLELDWLIKGLQSYEGATPLLLNKFLKLGRQRGESES